MIGAMKIIPVNRLARILIHAREELQGFSYSRQQEHNTHLIEVVSREDLDTREIGRKSTFVVN